MTHEERYDKAVMAFKATCIECTRDMFEAMNEDDDVDQDVATAVVNLLKNAKSFEDLEEIMAVELGYEDDLLTDLYQCTLMNIADKI